MRELSWLLLLLINANIYATILTPEEELLEPLLEHNYDRKHYHVPGPLFMQIWHNSRCGRDRLAPGPLEGPEQECWGYSNGDCCHVPAFLYDKLDSAWGSVRVLNLPKHWKVQLYAAAPTQSKPFQRYSFNPWTPCVYAQNAARSDRCLSVLGVDDYRDLSMVSLNYTKRYGRSGVNPFKLSARVWDAEHEPEVEVELPGIARVESEEWGYRPPNVALEMNRKRVVGCKRAAGNGSLTAFYARDKEVGGVVAKVFDDEGEYKKFDDDEAPRNDAQYLQLLKSYGAIRYASYQAARNATAARYRARFESRN